MNPQPPSNDLAERFALIIDGLCKAVVTPQGPFRAVFFFFMRRRIQKELELIGQQFAHLIELLRAGKLTPAPASDSPVDSDAASSPPDSSPTASSSPPAPAVPTSERPRAVDWLYPANHEPGAGEGFRWAAPMAACHQRLAAGASGVAEEWVDLAPAPATAVHGCEHDRASHHAAEAELRRKRLIRPGEPRPASGAAQFRSFPMSAELASPRLAWRGAVRARPPDPGFFAGRFALGLGTP